MRKLRAPRTHSSPERFPERRVGTVARSSYLTQQDRSAPNYGALHRQNQSSFIVGSVGFWNLYPAYFLFYYFFYIYIFFPSLHHLQPKMSAVWINAIWILSFALLDVAFSNYSEDQCSWRGRQVISLQSYYPRVDPNETLAPKTREAAGATLCVFLLFLERLCAR